MQNTVELRTCCPCKGVKNTVNTSFLKDDECKFSTTYTNIVPNGAKRIGEVYVQYSWPLHLTLVVLACQASERAEWAERLVELQTEEKQTADVDAVELGAPMAPEKVFHFEPISIGDIEILRYWTTFWDIEIYWDIFLGPFISSCIETQLIADVKHPNTPQKGTPVTNVKAQAVRYIYQYTIEFTGSWSESFT